MKPITYTILWVTMPLLLVLACSVGTVHAQSAGRGDPPAQSGEQAGARPEHGSMEGMREGQGDGRPMTCV